MLFSETMDYHNHIKLFQINPRVYLMFNLRLNVLWTLGLSLDTHKLPIKYVLFVNENTSRSHQDVILYLLLIITKK